MDADGADIQLPSGGPLIERLDILKDMLEFKTMAWNEIFGQCIEHEGIIWVRGVSESNCFGIHDRMSNLGCSFE